MVVSLNILTVQSTDTEHQTFCLTSEESLDWKTLPVTFAPEELTKLVFH